MPSRNDVAKLAGVSGATVSYVLNNVRGVSLRESTRLAVLKAADELGYRPSLAGRALQDGQFQQLGVLAPHGDTLFTPYHEGLLRGIWRAASQARRRVVMDTVGPDGQMSFIDLKIVDGLVALGLGPDNFPAHKQRVVLEQGFPIVMIGGGSWSRDFHTFDIDNVLLGRQAAEYLVTCGHRCVMAFGGNNSAASVLQRREGLRQGLAEHGLILEEKHIVPTFTAEADEGHHVGLDVLRQLKGVTAAFCFNDTLAMGLMRAARDLGLDLPRDLSVLGVDAVPMGEFTHPRLSSFRQPLEQMGEEAARLLLDPPKGLSHRLYPFTLVEGESVRVITRKRKNV